MKSIARRLDGLVRRARARCNDGVVPFSEGRFVAARDRPAFAARTYYEVRQLYDFLAAFEITPRMALEVGSGYGRLAPWIAFRSKAYYGLEPNDGARHRAQELYPRLKFHPGVAQSIPYGDGDFDFVVSWTVLQHIPPREAHRACHDIARVTRPGGYVLLSEKTMGEQTAVVHPRSPEAYASTLPGCELIQERSRLMEPERDTNAQVMLFRKEP